MNELSNLHIILLSRTIWNEHNAQIFRHKSASPMILLQHIKREAAPWVVAGAKQLGAIMQRRSDELAAACTYIAGFGCCLHVMLGELPLGRIQQQPLLSNGAQPLATRLLHIGSGLPPLSRSSSAPWQRTLGS